MLSSNFQCYTDISELNEWINPNPFPNENYGLGHHIGTPWGSSSPSQESGTSSTSSWWMPNLSFSIVKIERSVIHQIESILQDKSIGALKNSSWISPLESGISSMCQEGSLRNIPNISSVTLISQSSKKESTPILFQIKSMVRDIILEPLVVPDLQPRSQERPPWVPDGCQIYIFFNFRDREKCYTSNCKYFSRQIHWCTQNNLWTLSFESRMSSMYQGGSLKNISNISSVTLISQRWMKESTSIFFQI